MCKILQDEDTYNEHFKYEMEHGAFTVFKKGVYPTRKDAEKAINAGTLKGTRHALLNSYKTLMRVIRVPALRISEFSVPDSLREIGEPNL